MRVLKCHDQFENTLVRSNVIGLSSETLMVPPRIGWEIYHFGLPKEWRIGYTAIPRGRGIFHLSN